MLRFSLSIALVFLAIFLHGQRNYNLKITADITGLEDTTSLQLTGLSQDGMEYLDYGDAIPGERFELNTRIDGAGFHQLTITKDDYIVIITQPGETIHLEVDMADPENPTVEGSPATRLFYDFLPGFLAYEGKKDSLERVFSQAFEAGKAISEEEQEAMVDLYYEKETRQKEMIAQLLEANPNKLTGLMFAELMDEEDHFEVMKSYARSIYNAYPDNHFAENFYNRMMTMAKTAVGMPAPNLKVPGKDGKPMALHDVQGKVVMLHFWASWCSHCRRENKLNVDLYNKYKDNGFEIFSVSFDRDRGAWLNSIKEDSLYWDNHVSNLKGWESEAKDIYSVRSVPYIILINEEGQIIEKGLRTEELENKLKELFGY